MSLKADKIILGNIITLDDIKPYAKAMAVKDGTIMYVGSEKMAKKLCDEKTEIIDYGNNYIFPGFMDAHDHGMLSGWRAIGSANVFDGQSYAEYIDMMKAYIDANPGKSFYMGAGWIEKSEGKFTKECLDELAPDATIVLQSADGHSMLLSSKAMEKFEINKETAKKMLPGEVEYDENGELTGLIHEGPVRDIMPKLPMTIEEVKSYILNYQELAFSRGFTAHVEAGSQLVSKQQNEAYTDLAKEGKLKLRTYTYETVLDNTDTPEQDVEKTVELIKKYNTEHHKIIGLKTFLDGVIEARAAWMLDEFCDEPGYFGVPCFSDHDKMVRLIVEAAKYNLAVHCHSIGDAATKFFLDCVEEAQEKTGVMDQRNCLAHLEFVTPEDILRFADTNTIAITPPTWTMKLEENYRNAVSYVGQAKMNDEYPIKSFFDAGSVVVAHTDYPAGPFLDIPLSVFMACNRYYPELGEESLNNEKECVSRKQAIDMMTRNVAIQFKEEDRLGTLSIGKIANATILDTDILNCPNEDIMKTQVIATIVDGEEVYKQA